MAKQNYVFDFAYFENKAEDTGRSPIETNIYTIVRDGLAHKQYQDDAYLRRTQRQDFVPESEVLYRSGNEMVSFSRLCRVNPEKAAWLINNANSKAMGLMRIASEQTKVLAKISME
jgi:hypothetical protein